MFTSQHIGHTIKQRLCVAATITAAVLALSFQSTVFAFDKASVDEALQGENRSADNKARDKYRKPAEVLEFLGVDSSQTVVESWPGGGWYTQVLAPYLKDKGKLIAAEGRKSESLAKMLKGDKVYSEVVKVNFSDGNIAEANSVDTILDFRNAHNWLGGKRAEPLVKAWHQALKTGGVVGIVDHRMDDDSTVTARTGYTKEKDVIAFMESQGFSFVARSSALANPKDTKDYEGGVWTLPPVLRNKEKDKEKYLAIGESDRMLLKFAKK